MNLKSNSETVLLQKVNYGLDAPIFQRSALFGGLSAAILDSVAARWAQQHDSHVLFNSASATPVAWTGFWFFLTGCVMFWGSKVDKPHLRDKIIASIQWRGDERVLDVGCGHGLMLLAAAKQLKSGRAVGIDIFIFCFAVGASGHAEIHTYMSTVEILLGVANCAISLVLRWRGQFLIALLWWISAVAKCFVSMRLVMPILVFDTLVGFLGFGLYLMYRERRDRRLRVQHA